MFSTQEWKNKCVARMTLPEFARYWGKIEDSNEITTTEIILHCAQKRIREVFIKMKITYPRDRFLSLWWQSVLYRRICGPLRSSSFIGLRL